MSTNPFIPYDFSSLAEPTLLRTREEYRDLLAAIRMDLSPVAGGLKLQVEEALNLIEAELSARSLGQNPHSG
jgi:hypothetical protein